MLHFHNLSQRLLLVAASLLGGCAATVTSDITVSTRGFRPETVHTMHTIVNAPGWCLAGVKDSTRDARVEVRSPERTPGVRPSPFQGAKVETTTRETVKCQPALLTTR
jgi:hypothetical protein